MGAGFQVCTHAIGDRANFLTLNAYEEALSSLRLKFDPLLVNYSFGFSSVAKMFARVSSMLRLFYQMIRNVTLCTT